MNKIIRIASLAATFISVSAHAEKIEVDFSGSYYAGGPAQLSGDFVYDTDEPEINPGTPSFAIESGSYTYSIDINNLPQSVTAAIDPSISAIVNLAFPSGNTTNLYVHLNNEFIVSINTLTAFPADMLPSDFVIIGGHVGSQSDYDSNPDLSYHVLDDTPPPSSPAPEPASWAMFIGGFGLIGSAMRLKRVNVSLA